MPKATVACIFVCMSLLVHVPFLSLLFFLVCMCSFVPSLLYCCFMLVFYSIALLLFLSFLVSLGQSVCWPVCVYIFLPLATWPSVSLIIFSCDLLSSPQLTYPSNCPLGDRAMYLSSIIYLHVFRAIRLSIYALSVYLSTSLSIARSIFLSTHQTFYSPASRLPSSIYRSVQRSIDASLSMCPSIQSVCFCPSIYPLFHPICSSSFSFTPSYPSISPLSINHT